MNENLIIRLEFIPIEVGGALALVQLAASGIFYAKTKDLTDLCLMLIFGPGVNLCWLIVCGTYLLINGLYCETNPPLAFYIAITYGYAIVIPAIKDICLLRIGIMAMNVEAEQTV